MTRRLTITKIRLRSAWLLVPAYLLLARPLADSIALGAAFALCGGLIRAWAAGAIHKNRELTTRGAYAFTRNPLYLGTFLIGIGFAVASGRLSVLLFFMGFFVVVYGKAMENEERRLERLFGAEFRGYASAVPRFFPRLPPWSDVVGRTSPTRRGQEGAGFGAAEATRAPFRLELYLANGEHQTALGMAVIFLLLAAKLVF